MFDKMDNKTYSYIIGLLLLSSSLLGLLFLLSVITGLVGLGSYACLCLTSMGLYVIIIILLGTSGIIALVNIEHDLVMFFTFTGFVADAAVTVFMMSTFFYSSYGMNNITLYSGLAFLSIFSASALLFIALIYLKKARLELRNSNGSPESNGKQKLRKI